MAETFKEDLELLVQLQTKDRELDRLRLDGEEIVQQIQAQRDALDSEKRSLAKAQERGRQVVVTRREKELELAEKEAAIRKHQAELNAIKTNEAFRALITEIDLAKDEKKTLEDQILQLMEESEDLVRAEKEEAVQIQKLSSETAVRIGEFEKKRQENEAKKAVCRQERDQMAPRLPPSVLSRYQTLFERRKGVAVVAVEGDSCGGCHMKLIPQTQVEVRKGGKPVTCPNCQRILYLENQQQKETESS